jgi:flagellum-specific ATP synthase
MVDADPPPALSRGALDTPLRTGVKVLDIFAPLVEGQRMGVFAGSGVGKSTLLGMIAAASSFDVVVAALVGERGREVNEMLEGPLKPHRERTVAVVSTGDETAMMRRLAPLTAMTVAEHFRAEGRRVLLVVDSLTRAAHAARDVALAAGEAPVYRGYPPSVFADLTRLAERAGRDGGAGSITGVLAVLVDGDDMEEPVADAARGTLDGHIVLSRAIAEAGRYPAVDPLASLSRLAPRAFRPDEIDLARRLRALVSRYEDTRDLRLLGGHKSGADPELDRAVAVVPQIYDALVQTPADPPCADAFGELARVLSGRAEEGGGA